MAAASEPPERAGLPIPFNRPSLEGNEVTYMVQAVEGGHTSAKGPFATRAEALLREETGAREVLLTTSGTDSLELSAMLLDLRPGDTVIVPSFTFVTTALAFVREGARLLFADIEPTTLGIDPAQVADLLDDSVRAVVPVHYAGVACDIAGLFEVLSGRPDVDVVEDAAHALFGTYRGSPLGSFGRVAALSFHETKNFTCGEGGALLVNRDEDVDRAHVLLDKGTNRRDFARGRVDKYTWTDVGSSFGLSDLLAAYLLGQLEAKDRIIACRRRVFERYLSHLEAPADLHGYAVPHVPPDRHQAYHMFYVLLPTGEGRDRVLAELNAKGIQATFHYVPLHSSPRAPQHVARATECPVTDDVSRRLLRLPFYNSLSDDDIDRIAEDFLKAVASLA